MNVELEQTPWNNINSEVIIEQDKLVNEQANNAY